MELMFFTFTLVGAEPELIDNGEEDANRWKLITGNAIAENYMEDILGDQWEWTIELPSGKYYACHHHNSTQREDSFLNVLQL